AVENCSSRRRRQRCADPTCPTPTHPRVPSGRVALVLPARRYWALSPPQGPGRCHAHRSRSCVDGRRRAQAGAAGQGAAPRQSTRGRSGAVMDAGSSVALVCPACRGEIDLGVDRMACRQCREVYEYRGGFPDLIVGGRFADEDDEARTKYEEESNAYLARNYLIPTFLAAFGGVTGARVLSLGCGTGVDVDLMAGAGFDMVGIDCGNRTAVRSEEHTSELQSRFDLVCRLLLEKKKKKHQC